MSLHVIDTPAGKRHVVRWREGERNRSRTFSGPKAARDARAFDLELRRTRSLRGADHLLARDVTLAQWTEEWIFAYAIPHLTADTRAVYGVQLEHRIMPFLGDLPLRQITPAVLEEWTVKLVKRGDGRPSIVKACTVLSAIMQRAAVNGLIDANPVRVIRKPSQTREREPEPISAAVIECIRGSLERRDATLVSVLAYAGLRPESEAVVLRWRDVGERTLKVRAIRKRGSRERHVRLQPPLAADLAEWRAVAPRGLLVFPAPAGEAWTRSHWRNWVRRVWRPAAEAAGLVGSRPRDLRGSYASMLIAEGLNVVEVAQQMGHSAQMCLDSYARAFAEFDPAHRQSAAETIEEARRNQ